MSEQRYSLWHILAVVAIVLALGAVSLGGGLFLGYQWGHAAGRAQALSRMRAQGAAPRQVIPVPFDRAPQPGGQAQRPYLGVRFEMITPELAQAENLSVQSGALIREVVPDGPADQAGLKAGDIVQKVDGEPVDAEHTLRARIAARHPGDEVTLTVLREGETHEIKVTLGHQEAGEVAPSPEGEFGPRFRIGPGFRFELRCSPEPCPDLPLFRFFPQDRQENAPRD